MQLTRLDVTAADLERWPALVSEDERPLVVRVSDADTVVVVAAVAQRWSGSWGVWLSASEDYPAALIARDVKTLAVVMDLDHVVIDADHDAPAHAAVVEALLSDAAVTLHNAVATITDAYNRPVPPRPVCVWHVEGEDLVHGARVLYRREGREGVGVYVEREDGDPPTTS